jgi:hypothetical protein
MEEAVVRLGGRRNVINNTTEYLIGAVAVDYNYGPGTTPTIQPCNRSLLHYVKDYVYTSKIPIPKAEITDGNIFYHFQGKWSSEQLRDIADGMKFALNLFGNDPDLVTILRTVDPVPTVSEDNLRQAQENQSLQRADKKAYRKYKQALKQHERGLVPDKPSAVRRPRVYTRRLSLDYMPYTPCELTEPGLIEIPLQEAYIDAVSESDRAIIKLYTYAYDSQNEKLRLGLPMNFIEYAVYATLSNVLLNMPPLKEDVILYRGMKGLPQNLHRVDHFVSTTSDYDVARGFLGWHRGERCCLMKIHVPAGTNIIPLYDLTEFEGELELLLPPGQFNIVGEYYCDFTKVYEVRYVPGKVSVIKLSEQEQQLINIIANIRLPEGMPLADLDHNIELAMTGISDKTLISKVHRILLTKDDHTGYFLIEGLYRAT